METRLNPNQINGSVGGGTVGELYIDDLRTNDGDLTKWIELFPGNPSEAKCNNGAEYFCELRTPFSSSGMIFAIGDVLSLHYVQGDGLLSRNIGADSEVIIMNDYQQSSDVPYIQLFDNQNPISLKCVINGTTKTWYYRSGGLWVALTHDEEGVAVPSAFSDTGINTASTSSNMLLNNVFYDFPCTCDFNFTAFRITDNGRTVFDGRSATRGVDYGTYRRNGDDTVPAVIKLTHYL